MEIGVIREAKGNLLTAQVDALVNTVNTVGVMGKGIALQFKRAYPAMFEEYQKAAKAGAIEPGRMHVWPTGALEGPRFIINFPTKRHWRAPSRLEDISSGLDDLARVIETLEITSIAIPPLGAGNGGLDWRKVAPLIEKKLSKVAADVVVYPPQGAPPAADMVEGRPRPHMTPGRAALLAIMRRYLSMTWEAPSLVEIQKLMYFLQEAGEELNLRFEKGVYGPYADNLRHVLTHLEGHYISGFDDGSAKVPVAEPLKLLDEDLTAVDEELADNPETQRRVNEVMALIDGYETAYGLELLASVHWLGAHDPAVRRDPDTAARAVSHWTDRKRKLFTPNHVATAWQTLDAHGWAAPAR